MKLQGEERGEGKWQQWLEQLGFQCHVVCLIFTNTLGIGAMRNLSFPGGESGVWVQKGT